MSRRFEGRGNTHTNKLDVSCHCHCFGTENKFLFVRLLRSMIRVFIQLETYKCNVSHNPCELLQASDL